MHNAHQLHALITMVHFMCDDMLHSCIPLAPQRVPLIDMSETVCSAALLGSALTHLDLLTENTHALSPGACIFFGPGRGTAAPHLENNASARGYSCGESVFFFFFFSPNGGLWNNVGIFSD